MARESFIEINYIDDKKPIYYVADLLCRFGWSLYNPKGQIEYLPLGDNDDFNWKAEAMPKQELEQLMLEKQKNDELAGINLFYEGTDFGISLTGKNTDDICISLDINRYKIDESRESLTNISWYFEKIIKILYSDKSMRFSYKIVDFIS